MIPLVVSDNLIAATKLRTVLAQNGHDCPTSRVVSTVAALEAVQTISSKPDLILVVTGEEQERSEELLRGLRAMIRTRIVAIGRKEPSRILGAVRAGADDYIDESSNLHEELAAFLQRVLSNPEPTAGNGQLTSIVAGSGGSGRTTVAVNLAAMAAKQHGKSALLDFDLRTGAAAAMLDLKPRHSIVDLCRGLNKLDRNMFEQSLTAHECGVHLLPSPEMPGDVPEITSDGIARIIRFARAAFPRVFVDLNDVTTNWSKQLLQQSTAVLLLSRLDFASIQNARRTYDLMERNGVSGEKIHFLVARSGQPSELPTARVEQALGLKVYESLPDDPKAINLATNCGRPCVLEAPQTRFSQALTKLGRRLDPPADSPATGPSPSRSAAAESSTRAQGTQPGGWFRPLFRAATT